MTFFATVVQSPLNVRPVTRPFSLRVNSIRVAGVSLSKNSLDDSGTNLRPLAVPKDTLRPPASATTSIFSYEGDSASYCPANALKESKDSGTVAGLVGTFAGASVRINCGSSLVRADRTRLRSWPYRKGL